MVGLQVYLHTLLTLRWVVSFTTSYKVNETSKVTGKEIPSQQQDNARRNPAVSRKIVWHWGVTLENQQACEISRKQTTVALCHACVRTSACWIALLCYTVGIWTLLFVSVRCGLLVYSWLCTAKDHINYSTVPDFLLWIERCWQT